MQKSVLFALAGLLIVSNTYALHQNERDYNQLLERSTFNKNSHVRKLKHVAALMVTHFASHLRIKKPFDLSPDQINGAQKLEKYSYSIINKLGVPSKGVESAYTYAITPFDQLSSIPELLAMPKEALMKAYFATFNQNYAPLIDAITKTYGKETLFPHELSLQTLEEWAHRNKTTEPGI